MSNKCSDPRIMNIGYGIFGTISIALSGLWLYYAYTDGCDQKMKIFSTILISIALILHIIMCLVIFGLIPTSILTNSKVKTIAFVLAGIFNAAGLMILERKCSIISSDTKAVLYNFTLISVLLTTLFGTFGIKCDGYDENFGLPSFKSIFCGPEQTQPAVGQPVYQAQPGQPVQYIVPTTK